MADTSIFLNGRNLKVTSVDVDNVSSGTSGVLLTITPASDEFVRFWFTYLGGSDAIQLSVGGSVIYSGNLASVDNDQVDMDFFGDFGEVVEFEKLSGTTDGDLSVYHQIVKRV